MAIAQRPDIVAPTDAGGAPRRRIAPTLLGVAVGGTGVLWLFNGGLGQFGDRGGVWLIVGQWAGIVSALAALVGLVLVARPTWLERTEGLDRLWAWHRIAGMTTVFALLVHLVASTVGFAGGSVRQAWDEFLSLLSGSSWMVAATVATALFLIVAGTSWRRIRARMPYEMWLGVHVAGYLAVLLGFGHQLTLSTDFSAATPISHWWWIGLFVAAMAAVLWSRIGGLIRAAATGRARVTRVTTVAVNTVAIEMQTKSRRLRRVTAGQFFLIRMLTADLWWQAHPISISARPRDGILRFTIKLSGDGSEQMAAVPPGTRVVLEGPYGTFTAARAQGRPVLLIGGGVGLTVIRAVLADCSADQRPVVVARVPGVGHIPHLTEIRAMVAERQGRLLVVDGPRNQWPGGRPFAPEHLLTAVPDLAQRDTFICGPPALERELERSLRAAKVPADRIHLEYFGV